MIGNDQQGMPEAKIAFFSPMRLMRRQYLAAKWLFRFLDAAQAHSQNTSRRALFPCTALDRPFLPALSLFPAVNICLAKQPL